MKILVVDDRPAVRDPIVEAFRGAGHAAAGAATGAAALAHLTNDKPNALLLGLQLPDISGLEVLRALRGISATALLPVILLTSRETRENILTAARLGVQGYVLKNKFAMKDLLACVEKYDPGSRSAGAGRRAAASAGEKPGGEMPQLMTREEFLNRARPVLEASSTQTIEDAIRQVGCGCLGDIAAAV
ncbi:MAG TPA: response regulator, partial [Tepidisphaeraceae bacterium]|nr:response regulator [Tepidisphaeraceae bacterium]